MLWLHAGWLHNSTMRARMRPGRGGGHAMSAPSHSARPGLRDAVDVAAPRCSFAAGASSLTWRSLFSARRWMVVVSAVTVLGLAGCGLFGGSGAVVGALGGGGGPAGSPVPAEEVPNLPAIAPVAPPEPLPEAAAPEGPAAPAGAGAAGAVAAPPPRVPLAFNPNAGVPERLAALRRAAAARSLR